MSGLLPHRTGTAEAVWLAQDVHGLRTHSGELVPLHPRIDLRFWRIMEARGNGARVRAWGDLIRREGHEPVEPLPQTELFA